MMNAAVGLLPAKRLHHPRTMKDGRFLLSLSCGLLKERNREAVPQEKRRNPQRSGCLLRSWGLEVCGERPEGTTHTYRQPQRENPNSWWKGQLYTRFLLPTMLLHSWKTEQQSWKREWYNVLHLEEEEREREPGTSSRGHLLSCLSTDISSWWSRGRGVSKREEKARKES